MTENKNEESGSSVGAGSQTLMRGLDILEAVSEEGLALAELSERIGLAKSTTYRLATALADRGYLAYTPRAGYRLGAKLLQLGAMAQAQIDLIQVARDYLERLSSSTGDTVHMGVLDGDQALYLDKVPGRRRITISSRVGDRQPLSSTGLGKALMLDHPPAYWMERFERDQEAGSHPADPGLWRERMGSYAAAGRAFDLEENEDQIRCVAAPIRDVAGKIVGAISVSSAAQYMDDQRMVELTTEVVDTARAISAELGWDAPKHKGR
jgi:DNA-binding IclR family transcriptional regulator